ncbi:MAG: hypothetical protein ONB46_13855 [candidate division KSB1 bacterium]|nr:hypothetical protein [candidate division KSB1 bacterium]MDZ7369499.1 hypothetical protein [candidate division KSB1 bacterium]MDZ7407596.1 hypothetical protein [candidate division KSB1 bacterium]
MAQEILVKAALEKEKIEAGKELLQRLAKTDFKVAAALWLWRLERPRWKLVIASPMVNKKGLLEAYNFIDTVYGKPRPIPDSENFCILPLC